MVADIFLNILMAIPYGLLSAMDFIGIDFAFPSGIFEIIKDLIVGVNYVCPIDRLMPLFHLSLALAVCKIMFALGIRIKSFIPTMGA